MRYRSIAVIALATCAATSAHAVSTVNANGSVTLDAVDPNYVFTIDFNGRAGSQQAAAPALDALGVFTFLGTSNGNTAYNFSYTLANESTVAARIRSLAFNSDVNATGASATGSYAFTSFNENFPVGLGNREICLRATSNGSCTGGNQGLTQGQSGAGTFSLSFAAAQAVLTLADFAIRIQSISPEVNRSSSGVGVGVIRPPAFAPEVPEPATWAMLIAGFGLVGVAARRRRTMTITA